MPNTLCWTDIPVVDLDRAIQFYSAILGAEVKKQRAEGYTFGLLPCAETNASGCLYQAPDNEPSVHGPLVYLSVHHPHDDALAAVVQHGGAVLQGKHPIGPHGYRSIIRDSEGNRIALHSLEA